MARSGCKRRSKRVTWSPEEDHKLIAYVSRYGHWNWNYVAQFAGLLRWGKSRRLRWKNYLMPNLKHGDFSIAEEETIINMQRELGNKWSLIASKLSGRTDNEIKNYWNCQLKKQVKCKSPPPSSPDIRACTFKNFPINSENYMVTFASDKNYESSNSIWFGLEEIIQMPNSTQLSNPSYDSWESIDQVESDASSVITRVVEVENVISDPFERFIELGKMLEEPFQYGPLFDDNGSWQY